MIYIVYKDGSWNETESDLEAAEYAGSKIWLVTIRGNESRPIIDICAPEYHASLDEAGDIFCRMCGKRISK